MSLRSIVPSRLSISARLFLYAIFLNGIGNGILEVIMQLYFVSLGFDGASIGSLVMMNAIGAALLTIPAGLLADRYGKKRMMIGGFALSALAIILILSSRDMTVLRLGFLTIGLGNAMFVVLTPLYSSFFEEGDLDRAFGLNVSLNIVAFSLGNLFGFVPPILMSRLGFGIQTAYWALLLIGSTILFVQMPLYLLSTRGLVERKSERGFKFGLKSLGVAARFTLIAVLVNVAVGVFFTLFPYYANSKFGVESDTLGSLFFVSRLVSAGFSALAPRVSLRLGTARTITIVLSLAAPFYFLIPLAPSWTSLSVFYIARICFAALSDPLITSLFMRNLNKDEKATANSIRMMGVQGGSIIAPWIGGQLMTYNDLDLPAYLGAVLYAVLACSSYSLLRNFRNNNSVKNNTTKRE